MSAFLRLFGKLDRRLLLSTLLFMFVSAAAEVISVALLRGLFLVCVGQPFWGSRILEWLMRQIFPATHVGVVLPVFCVSFAFIVAKNGAVAYGWHRVLHLVSAAQAKTATALFEGYLRQPYPAHTTQSWPTLQHQLNTIATQMFGRLVIPSLQTASEGLVLAAIMAYLMIKAPLTTVVLGLWLAGSICLFRQRVHAQSRNLGQVRDTAATQMFRLANDGLSDFKTIKVRASEAYFTSAFHERALHHAYTSAGDRYMVMLPRFLFEPLLIGGIGILYLILEALNAPQATILTNLTLYAAASMRMLPAAQRVTSQMHVLAFDHSTILNAVSALEMPPEVLPDRPQELRQQAFEHAICFEHVALAYPGKHPVIRNINLEIRPGDKIAITGRTGAGKTSFVNLLLGLLPPTSGRILIDGSEQPLLARYRASNIAYVQQDIFLFDTSIVENMAYGIAGVQLDTDRLWAALRQADIEQTVRAMPEGLRTRVGENGLALSGGERQRLALARAFYQAPSFLILDEATSQVDVATEAAILQDILHNRPDLTVVMVTHRATTARMFLRRFQVSDGTVAELSSSPESVSS